LPFCYIQLTAIKLTCYSGFDGQETLGDHLRARRLKLGLLQKTTGQHIGVSEETILHWEKNQTEPIIKHYPKIMEFLGYCPWHRTHSYGERFALYRTHRGLSIKELAQTLGADEHTVSLWERGGRVPNRKHALAIQALLGLHPVGKGEV